MKIAVIPARGGSQRIPRKNLLMMPHGQCTVLANAIKQARAAQCEMIYVSTDDVEIAKEAERYDAIPVMRQSGLARDDVGTQEVIASECEKYASPDDTVVGIYPCTPLLIAHPIKQALYLLSSVPGKFIVSVGKFQTPIHLAFESYSDKDEILSLRRCMPQFAETHTFPARYFDAGQFYIGKAKLFTDRVDLTKNAAPYFLPATRAIDINTHEDWLVACALYKGLFHDD